MRPSLLDPLFAPVTSLPGVGPKVADAIARIVPTAGMENTARIVDLLFCMPTRVIDRRDVTTIADAIPGTIATLRLRVDRHQPAPRAARNAPYRVFCQDETGEIALTFFRAHGEWLTKQLPEGEIVMVSGTLDWFNGRASMVHPDAMAREEAGGLPPIETVYPGTAGLAPKTLRKAIDSALERIPNLPEWRDPSVNRDDASRPPPTFQSALERLHDPQEPDDVLPDSRAWRRLARDELLAGQLAIALVRARLRRRGGRAFSSDGAGPRAIEAALPFQLTEGQRVSIAEIAKDLGEPEKMLRLLQGDVGSGKTVVALMAMAHVADAGAQSVLMAPTEILARQHFSTIRPIAEAAGLKVAILTGRDGTGVRQPVLDGLADGSIDICVGTHALFQQGVTFHDLGFAVVDEQHRFGVHQRLALSAKGLNPDLLVMTATPIPRTLVLTAFGDMDVSRLTEKPAGRQPIQTASLPIERLSELAARLEKAIADGRKVYWICPLVEESEQSDLVSAAERHAWLGQQLGADRVGLIHGRMSGPEKDAAMAAFKAGQTRLLVGTTVIEVGVDVPDASIIVIEHAERFGLSQLHQLRGRVGRGADASSCVLLFRGPLNEIAEARLKVMRETEDGFRIAEEDLRLRGEGDLLGTKQSGTPGFRVARLDVHADLLAEARQEARLILATDPDLAGPRGEALRILLYLFDRDEAVRLLRAG
ncbi:ATP-dependent DNA helicase RecG [Notoacmeibacter sp. MSK16QG-6]|uniref:ATP-dependent DNA helicase RecG n=1 Tax=Notoacmeibacter sp. MSK16QG-6 TaxID=2957982 RepID=UPI0020A14829|nr:ATP-dependent DNA helicase RecG [Notoacmeibacter sp. MSK16QG-6]MCP1200731.1 ATP-dependent DNA helicase RecG [Notoacmeibacter sp. MSK16QG-6]